VKRRSKNYWGKGGGAVVAERSGKGVEVEEERDRENDVARVDLFISMRSVLFVDF